MVTATFQPAAAPGAAAATALGTAGATQSYMDRASRLRMDQEVHALRMQEEEVLRPVREQQARAETAAARNKLASMEQTEAMRATAHGEMPTLRDEWAQASQINEPGERVRALSAVLGKAAKYESVGELKNEIDVWKHVLASQAVTERTLEAVNARLAGAKELEAAKAEHQKELANVKGENDRLKQEVANKGRVDAAAINAGGQYQHLIRSYQAAVEAGDDETAQLLDAQIKKRNHIAQPYSDAERIKTLNAEAAAAEQEGNPALAKALRDRITYLTKRNNPGNDREAKIRAILGDGKPAAGAAPAAPPASGGKPAAGTNPFQNLKF